MVILVNAADLEDEEPLPQTTAEALLKAGSWTRVELEDNPS